MLLPSIITLFIALATGYLAFRMKHPLGIIIMLFVYTTFHYTYSALPVFFWDKTIYIRDFTQQGVKLIGFAFIFYTIGLAGWRYRRDIFSKTATKTVKRFLGLFLIWLVAVLSFWVINVINKSTFPGGLAIQDFVSVLIMGISVWIFGTMLQADSKFDNETRINYKTCNRLLLVFTILMLTISVIQILTGRSFSGVNLSTGEYLHRACGLMFNPNVLGYWACLSAIIGAYGYHTLKSRKIVPILIMVFSCACILISGSRSGLIICLFTFTGISITLLFWKNIKIKNIFMPLIIIVSSILVIVSSIMLSDKITGRLNKDIHNLYLIAYRFAIAPVEVVTFINNKILLGTENESKNIDYSTTLSIKGRITTSETIPREENSSSNNSILPEKIGVPEKNPIINDTADNNNLSNMRNRLTFIPNITIETPDIIPTDNAYIAIYEEFGMAALVAWLLLGIWMLTLSAKAHMRMKSIESAYGLNLILAFAFSGIFMRSFQVFPFWVFNAILLSISFSIILRAGKSHRL